MRRFRIALVVLGLAASTASTVRAQTGFAAASGGFSDPFFLYYGFWLPRQQYLAAQPRAEDSIRESATCTSAFTSPRRSPYWNER